MLNNELNTDKVLIFDIKGPMAHFRKYFTNSSSLSYLFPPRTVIVGLIAGLLGFPSERHTKERKNIYYERFSKEQCLTAISIKTKIRRVMQTVNYIRTKSLSEINGSGGGTQIRLEILLPEKGDDITYRVYFYHVDEEIYDKLKERLEGERFVFPPFMGITEFLGSIKYIHEGKLSINPNRDIELNSVCKLKEVELDFSGNDLQYLIEKMPTDFSNDRTPKKPEEYLLEVKNRRMRVKLKENAVCYSILYLEDGCAQIENIMFM